GVPPDARPATDRAADGAATMRIERRRRARRRRRRDLGPRRARVRRLKSPPFAAPRESVRAARRDALECVRGEPHRAVAPDLDSLPAIEPPADAPVRRGRPQMIDHAIAARAARDGAPDLIDDALGDRLDTKRARLAGANVDGLERGPHRDPDRPAAFAR